MGGLCSKSYNASSKAGNVNYYKSNTQQQQSDLALTRPPLSQPEVHENMEKQLQEPSKKLQEAVSMNTAQYPDDFYDGIPRFNRPMAQKSRSVRSIAKVSEVSSRIGRVGSRGLGKAVEVLDIVGSGMTNLNPSSGFSGVVTKGNELSILAFEVANTIVKGSNLMQSLSKRSVRHLKGVVLVSEGVQNLVSKDMDELLRIVAADKREELKIFSGEVVRFGNRCKDPQMHNLNRYFDKISRELTPQNGMKEEVETVIEQLMTLVQYTAELYHELQVLDRFEQDYQRKSHEEDNSVSTQKGDSLTILKAELKSQRKQVKVFKKKSLWSRSLEQVMEKLVDIVHFLLMEIHNAFGSADGHLSANGSVSNHQRLGPAGLALHYANIVMQIDTLVARSSSMPPNTRDALYQSLPPSIKSALHSKLQTFHVKEELTVTEIKAEMEKTLQWLVPIATNTAKAHHGFGWVGEWANTGSEANRKPTAGPTDVIRIETLHHADKEKTEAYILEQVLWLHHLVSQSKTVAKSGGMRSPIKSPISATLQKTNQQSKHESSSATSLTIEDQLILQDVSKKRRIPGISKSQDFDFEKTRLRTHDRLSKSSSHTPTRVSKESVTVKRLPSGVPVISFGMEKKKALDAIDRVGMLT